MTLTVNEIREATFTETDLLSAIRQSAQSPFLVDSSGMDSNSEFTHNGELFPPSVTTVPGALNFTQKYLQYLECCSINEYEAGLLGQPEPTPCNDINLSIYKNQCP